MADGVREGSLAVEGSKACKHCTNRLGVRVLGIVTDQTETVQEKHCRSRTLNPTP